MKNLFGEEVVEPSKTPKSGHKRTFYVRRYRKADHPIRRCKFCKHLVLKDTHNKRYYKCNLIGSSNAITTDIRLRNVCDLWDMNIPDLEAFERWYDANFWEGRDIKKKILSKVKELYENSHNNL